MVAFAKPVWQFFATRFARHINRQLSAAWRVRFARYAGSHIGLQLQQTQVAVWRLHDDGSWQATSPLIDADVVMQWRGIGTSDAGDGGMHISGNAGLLKLLSDYQQSIDLPAFLIDAFPPPVSPLAFYAWQRVREQWQQWADANVVTPAQSTAQQQRFAEIQSRLARVIAKINQLENANKESL